MKITRMSNVSDAAKVLSSVLIDALKNNNKVVWLIPGGSNIPISVEVSKYLPTILKSKLTVTLTDERYGNYGHKDSNWQQLMDEGFDFDSIEALPFLDKDNKQMTDQVKSLNIKLSRIIKNAYLIGQFGIGTDGHTAGIKPHSLATESEALVCGYQAPDFVRLTTAFNLIKKLDEAHVFALGSSKVQILEKLKHEDVPLPEMPAQIFKQVRKSVIYNEEGVI